MHYWKKRYPYSTMFMNVFTFKDNLDLKKIKEVALNLIENISRFNIKICLSKPQYKYVKREIDQFLFIKTINDKRTVIRSMDPTYSSYLIVDKNMFGIILDHCIFDGARSAECTKYIFDEKVEIHNIENMLLRKPSNILSNLIMPFYIGKMAYSKNYIRNKIDLKYCNYIKHFVSTDDVKKKKQQIKSPFAIILIANYIDTLFKALDRNITKLTLGITVAFKKNKIKNNNKYAIITFEVPKLSEIDDLIHYINSSFNKNKYQILGSFAAMGMIRDKFLVNLSSKLSSQDKFLVNLSSKLSSQLRRKIDVLFSSIPVSKNDASLDGNTLISHNTYFDEVAMPIYVVFKSYGRLIYGTTHSRISSLKLPEKISIK